VRREVVAAAPSPPPKPKPKQAQTRTVEEPLARTFAKVELTTGKAKDVGLNSKSADGPRSSVEESQ
jgi:hypothetical protein